MEARKKPSEEYLDFLRNNKEEIENYDKAIVAIQDYLIKKLHKYIDYHIQAGFTPEEIEKSFKGITLFNEKNLNI